MYRSRSQRSVLYLNLAGKLPASYTWSIGLYTGMEVHSNVYSSTSIDPDHPSYIRLRAKAIPSLAGIASLAKRWNRSTLALALQQEMKNKFSFHINGWGTTNPNLPIDITMNSLAYYDPYLLRLSHSLAWRGLQIHSSLEYQYWKHYRPLPSISSKTPMVILLRHQILRKFLCVILSFLSWDSFSHIMIGSKLF